MTLYAQPSLEWNGAQCRAWLIYQAVANETLTVAVEIVLILRSRSFRTLWFVAA